MNPFKLWRSFKEGVRLDGIVNRALESLPYDDDSCGAVADTVRAALRKNVIAYRRFLITTNPPGYELGHIYYPKQFGHEVIEVREKILDPFYPISLPLEEYLQKAYRPKKGVQIVANELDMSGKIIDFQHT